MYGHLYPLGRNILLRKKHASNLMPVLFKRPSYTICMNVIVHTKSILCWTFCTWPYVSEPNTPFTPASRKKEKKKKNGKGEGVVVVVVVGCGGGGGGGGRRVGVRIMRRFSWWIAILSRNYLLQWMNKGAPRWGGSNEYPQSMFWAEIWKLSEFLIRKFQFLEVKFIIYLNRHVFVMANVQMYIFSRRSRFLHGLNLALGPISWWVRAQPYHYKASFPVAIIRDSKTWTCSTIVNLSILLLPHS